LLVVWLRQMLLTVETSLSSSPVTAQLIGGSVMCIWAAVVKTYELAFKATPHFGWCCILYNDTSAEQAALQVSMDALLQRYVDVQAAMATHSESELKSPARSRFSRSSHMDELKGAHTLLFMCWRLCVATQSHVRRCVSVTDADEHRKPVTLRGLAASLVARVQRCCGTMSCARPLWGLDSVRCKRAVRVTTSVLLASCLTYIPALRSHFQMTAVAAVCRARRARPCL
jgi:hypothetical protein